MSVICKKIVYPQDTFYSPVFIVAKENLLTQCNEVKEQFTVVLYPEQVLSLQGEEWKMR